MRPDADLETRNTQAAHKDAFLNKTLPTTLKYLTLFSEKEGNNGYYVGNKVTTAFYRFMPHHATAQQFLSKAIICRTISICPDRIRHDSRRARVHSTLPGIAEDREAGGNP